LEPLAKAERLPKKFENMCAVRQPVQQGCGKMLLSHYGIPVAKFEVGGNDDRAAFIAFATLTNILQISITHSANSFR
jgi:hypothetical protein